jgi:hypothetical protein
MLCSLRQPIGRCLDSSRSTSTVSSSCAGKPLPHPRQCPHRALAPHASTQLATDLDFQPRTLRYSGARLALLGHQELSGMAWVLGGTLKGWGAAATAAR